MNGVLIPQSYDVHHAAMSIVATGPDRHVRFVPFFPNPRNV